MIPFAKFIDLTGALGKFLLRRVFGLFWVFLFLFGSLQAAKPNTGSLFLINDSPFILTATVIAADGTYLGQVSLQPGQQKNFTQSLVSTEYQFPGKPQVSLTPFTVIWQCPSRGYYSVCYMVSPGSTVKANDCDGYKFCDPKSPAPEEKPRIPERK